MAKTLLCSCPFLLDSITPKLITLDGIVSASARCGGSIVSLPARSAMVGASFQQMVNSEPKPVRGFLLRLCLMD